MTKTSCILLTSHEYILSFLCTSWNYSTGRKTVKPFIQGSQYITKDLIKFLEKESPVFYYCRKFTGVMLLHN
jgi:hypothetical protein